MSAVSWPTEQPRRCAKSFELKRSPALLALDLTEVNRQTATRKRQNGGTGSAAAGPVSTPQDYPAAQRFWCAELHLLGL